MGTRRKGRILAFQALYAWDMTGGKKSDLSDNLDLCRDEDQKDTDMDFTRLLFMGTVENVNSVDSLIRKHLVNWDFSRLNKVDLALLRLGVYELLFNIAPPKVIIDEAIDISKEYGTDDSFRFVNGVLDGVRKTLVKSGDEGEKL